MIWTAAAQANMFIFLGIQMTSLGILSRDFDVFSCCFGVVRGPWRLESCSLELSSGTNSGTSSSRRRLFLAIQTTRWGALSRDLTSFRDEIRCGFGVARGLLWRPESCSLELSSSTNSGTSSIRRRHVLLPGIQTTR